MPLIEFDPEPLSPEQREEIRKRNFSNIRGAIVPRMMGSTALRCNISPNKRLLNEDSSKKSLEAAEAWANKRGIKGDL